MSKICTIKIIDLEEQCSDFIYEIRGVLKHNYDLYVTDYLEEENVYCGTCKYYNNKCLQYDDETIKADSNVCSLYEVIENGKFL